ncbi:MAG: (2Fe-2S) ferredoxin domain-containing protein [Rhodospirillales bacterium]
MNNPSGDPPLFFDRHVFICTNQRPEDHPRGSCAERGGAGLLEYMKAKATEMELDRVRINSAGCLNRCENGPALVIYPEGVWYKCQSQYDVDQILEKHIRDRGRVEHIMLRPDE